MDIDQMKAGREMDLRVAERVMGWCWPADRCPICGWKFSASAEKGCVAGNCSLRPPPQTLACEGYGCYSTDIAAAMQVIEKLRSGTRFVYIEDFSNLDGSRYWWVGFYDKDMNGESAQAETLPLAINRAALKTIGVTDA